MDKPITKGVLLLKRNSNKIILQEATKKDIDNNLIILLSKNFDIEKYEKVGLFNIEKNLFYVIDRKSNDIIVNNYFTTYKSLLDSFGPIRLFNPYSYFNRYVYGTEPVVKKLIPLNDYEIEIGSDLYNKIVKDITSVVGYTCVQDIDIYSRNDRKVSIILDGDIINWEPDYETAIEIDADEDYDLDYDEYIIDEDYYIPNQKDFQQLKNKLKEYFGENFVKLNYFEKYGLMLIIKI